MATILVVDDNAVNREFLGTLIQYRGHVLLEASDGAEALVLVSKERPDLVITDILMPTIDGYEFVRRLRSMPEVADTPVIFCTAHFRESEAEDLAKKCGVDFVLTKPCDPKTVLRIIDACLSKAAPTSPAAIPESFDREHLRLLTDKLSRQTAELTTVNLRLEALIEIALQLSSERHHGRLLEEFCKSARDLNSAKYAFVGIVSAGGRGLDHFCASGLDLEALPALKDHQELQKAIAGLMRRQPIRMHNPERDPQAFGFPLEFPPFESLLAAPIVSLTQVYGWLCLFDRLGAGEFSQEDEHLAGVLGALVGRIYENGRMYELARQHTADLEREIAERERAEETVRNSEARYREAAERLDLALKASRTGVWTWDVVNDYITWDEYTNQIFGGAPGISGGTFAELVASVYPEDRDALILSAQAAAEGHPEVVFEGRVIWPDGSVHVAANRGQAFYDDTGRVLRITGVAQDITEQRRLEEQLRQAQKMEAVGQLAGGIAHDFNNVLNVIIGYSKLLLASSAPKDTAYRRIDEIRKAGERAASLTQQLLAFSRKQVLQPRVLNLADTLHDMDAMLRRTIGENIEIETTFDEDLAQVKIDPNQVQQVLLNLVVNARDAMPHGGKLALELRNKKVDGSSSRVHGIPPGEYVMLSVSDNGTGMSPEVRQRVFEPFFTTKEVGQGTGLGLATVYGIIQQSGGHIWLYSEPGVGTTFKIYLPRVDDPKEPAPGDSPKKMQPGEETILVVEDDPGLRALVREVLGSVGYEVLVAEDGNAALRVSAQYTGRVHLLLTDVILPKMGGREVASRLGSLRPEMKVLFMSGYTENTISQHGTLDPAVNFIQKPWTPEGLCEKIRTVLDARSSIQRVLVVDDEPEILSWFAEVLEQAGYEVFTAQGSREARARARIQPLDLVITDLAMPEEDGVEMIRAIRKEHPQLKIIAMSGVFGTEILRAALLLGAQATLTKPLKAEVVLQSIRDLSAS